LQRLETRVGDGVLAKTHFGWHARLHRADAWRMCRVDLRLDLLLG
jgi:hypothetical protein